MPKSAQYRVHTEQITKQRLSLVEQENDIPTLEKKLGAGQIEEVIKQAEDEFSLAKKMQEWQPWEPLQNPPPADQWKWPCDFNKRLENCCPRKAVYFDALKI